MVCYVFRCVVKVDDSCQLKNSFLMFISYFSPRSLRKSEAINGAGNGKAEETESQPPDTDR